MKTKESKTQKEINTFKARNMENYYCPPTLQGFKYYSGESENECPYNKDDVRSRFWWGERMFATGNENRKKDNIEDFYQFFKDDTTQWCEWLKEHKTNQSARMLRENNEKQLIVAFYIVLLYGKWCPYDSEDFIFDY